MFTINNYKYSAVPEVQNIDPLGKWGSQGPILGSLIHMASHPAPGTRKAETFITKPLEDWI